MSNVLVPADALAFVRQWLPFWLRATVYIVGVSVGLFLLCVTQWTSAMDQPQPEWMPGATSVALLLLPILGTVAGVNLPSRTSPATAVAPVQSVTVPPTVPGEVVPFNPEPVNDNDDA